MQDPRTLEVWQRARSLTVFVVRHTRGMHRNLWFLGDQMRRASNSIAAQVAEGAGSGTSAQFALRVGGAIAEANELVSHALIAADAEALPPELCRQIDRDAVAIRVMLIRLRTRIREREARAIDSTRPRPEA